VRSKVCLCGELQYSSFNMSDLLSSPEMDLQTKCDVPAAKKKIWPRGKMLLHVRGEPRGRVTGNRRQDKM